MCAALPAIKEFIAAVAAYFGCDSGSLLDEFMQLSEQYSTARQFAQAFLGENLKEGSNMTMVCVALMITNCIGVECSKIACGMDKGRRGLLPVDDLVKFVQGTLCNLCQPKKTFEM